jgi:hypothetical protein
MILLLFGLMALVSACGGDDGSETTAGTEESSTSVEAESDDDDSSDEGELPDNCTLVTAEEATALAGYELEMSEASCGFLEPGSSVADVVVRTVFADGDAATVASNGFPNAAEIIPVSVGDDTVAVTTPAGDAVASIVTASDGKILELAIVFLLIDPSDTARVEEAAQLAVTALGRWGG